MVLTLKRIKQMNTRINYELAPISLRFCAFFIDVIILILVELVVVFILMELNFFQSQNFKTLTDMGNTKVGEIIAITLYFPIFTAIFKASPGKMILKLKVVADDGHELNVAKILLRESIGRPLGTFLLGGLWPLLDKNRKTAWDFLVGSIVVKDK